jgi:hypothetical protein
MTNTGSSRRDLSTTWKDKSNLNIFSFLITVILDLSIVYD